MEEDIEMEDINDNSVSSDNEIKVYKKEEYEFDFIYNNLVQMKILVNQYSCPICLQKMKISKDKGVLDKKLFCYVSNNPKHDKKISLIIHSVFENI